MADAPLMAGKKGLIMGIANDRSLAWGIAEKIAAQGAELAITYQGDALAKRVLPLAEKLNAPIVAPADGRAVTFTEGGKTKNAAETIAGHH
jgi:enoyl-[acyl-carrier protein] reductase I